MYKSYVKLTNEKLELQIDLAMTVELENIWAGNRCQFLGHGAHTCNLRMHQTETGGIHA